jgi:hypothetical protein
MADQHNDWRTADQSHELNDPKNPPQSVLRPEARRAALLSYLGPVVALFAIVGIALIYWSNRGPVRPDERRERDAVGTVGADPSPRFRTTEDELQYRGTSDGGRAASQGIEPSDPLTTLDSVRTIGAAGRRVEIESAEVASVDGNLLWVTSDAARIAVLAPEGAAPVKAGAHVRIAGTTELDQRGDIRIRASRMDARSR